MKSYDLFVPCGNFCSTSFHLRCNTLQIEALPFDWIADLDFEKSVYYLLNNFDGFFRKENLKTVKIEGPNICCVDTKENLGFYHHLDSSLPFDKAYEKARQTLERRCDRLMAKIEKSEKILFVYAEEKNLDTAKIKESFSQLQKAYPQKTIDLLLFDLNENYEETEISEDGDITLAKINFKLNRDIYSGKKEEFAKVLGNYKISSVKIYFLNLWNKIFKKTKRLLINAACVFIPSKKARKAVRKTFKTNQSIFDK